MKEMLKIYDRTIAEMMITFFLFFVNRFGKSGIKRKDIYAPNFSEQKTPNYCRLSDTFNSINKEEFRDFSEKNFEGLKSCC